MEVVNDNNDFAEPGLNEEPVTHQRWPTHDPGAKINSTHLTSVICSAIHAILTYTVAVIIVAYFLVQAMETVSFVLGLHTGIVWKGLWVAYLLATGFVATAFVAAGHEVIVGPAEVERWRPGRA